MQMTFYIVVYLFWQEIQKVHFLFSHDNIPVHKAQNFCVWCGQNYHETRYCYCTNQCNLNMFAILYYMLGNVFYSNCHGR